MVYLKVDGGFVIKEESPTGKRIEDGEIFEATAQWYQRRKACSFLKVLTVQEFEAAQGKGEEESVSGSEPELVKESEDPLNIEIPDDYQALRRLALDVARERGDELESQTAPALREYLEGING